MSADRPAGHAAPVLAVFLDGLRFDSLARMPFLRGLTSVRPIGTELGYSITCHASMYTGVRPDRHQLWFVWQRDPSRSPFRFVRPIRFLDRVDNLPLHVVATKVARRLTPTTSWFGVPIVVHLPWRYFPELDVAERKLWTDPAYLATAETIFDRVRRARRSFAVHGMGRGEERGMAAFGAAPSTPLPDLTYLFAGDVDHVSHRHGQDSAEATEVLGAVDREIERAFSRARAIDPSVELVVWSDHGHHDVTTIDPFELTLGLGIDIRRWVHVIDTNFLRLWIDDSRERSRVSDALDSTAVGFVLRDEHLDRYRVRMPDDRYGNVIFYLDRPHAFGRTIWGFGRQLVSAHGYLPEYDESHGVFASSLATDARVVGLADVAPSLLDLLGLPAEPDLDGVSVWAR
jgi:hypothetical protein